MEFQSVPDFRLDDDAFEYQGRRYPYRDVVSIEFWAGVTKRSINFVPAGTSYDARLKVYLETGDSFGIKPARGWFGNLKEEGFEALQRVNSALSFMTFNFRVERYEKQLRDRGAFHMDGFAFHGDGNLSRNGKVIANLRDKSHHLLISPFEVTLSKKEKSLAEKLKLAWGGESVIDIGKDRDCFIYLMNRLFRISWTTERIPEKRVDTKKIYYDAVVRLGAWLSMADGNTDPSELAQLKRFFRIDADTFPEAAAVFNEQLRSPKSPQLILRPFIAAFREADEIRQSLYVGLLSVALADGVFHPGEKRALGILGGLLGFRTGDLVRIYAAVNLDYAEMFDGGGRKAGKGEGPGAGPAPTPLRIRHLRVLGLGGDATEAEIRAGYRKLVKKYHPDALRSQGLPEDEMGHAKRILGQVMESYEWLMKSG